MSALAFQVRQSRVRCGFKGSRAADWLAEQGIAVPSSPNTWRSAGVSGPQGAALLVARLGSSEYFLEDFPGGTALRGARSDGVPAPGVYPVLREDAAFLLSGECSLDVLAQACNVNFAALALESQPIIMTLMIGVAVLVLPEGEGAERQFRIWCDPTFGPYLEETLGKIVIECGGSNRGVSE